MLPMSVPEAPEGRRNCPFSAPGTGGRMSRAERWEAQRQAYEARRQELGPPPAPAPGGVAGMLFLPAAGSLLNEGRGSLLTEGTPLLTAPGGSLY